MIGSSTGIRAAVRALVVLSVAGSVLASGASATAPQSATVAGPAGAIGAAIADTPGLTAALEATAAIGSVAWSEQWLPGASESGSRAMGIAQRPGLLVAVGSDDDGKGSGRVPATWTSADGGRTWSEHLVVRPVTGAVLDGFTGVAMLNGRFVASTPAAGFWASRDGVTWTLAAGAPKDLRASTIHRGLGGLVIVAQSGDGTGEVVEIWQSTNGLVWERVADRRAFHDFCGTAFAASAHRLVVVGKTCSTGTVAVLVRRRDRTWTRAWPVGMSPGIVKYVGSRFVMISPHRIGERDGQAFWSSWDGVTWYRNSFVPTRLDFGPSFPGGYDLVRDESINDLVKVGNLWVAVGGWGDTDNWAGGLAWTSPDLRHWRRDAFGNGDLWQGMGQAIVVDGRIVAVGGGENWPSGEQARVWIGVP